MAVYRERVNPIEAVYFDGKNFFEPTTKKQEKAQISPWFLKMIASTRIFHGEDGYWWIAHEEADTYGGEDTRIYANSFVVWDPHGKRLSVMSAVDFARHFELHS